MFSVYNRVVYVYTANRMWELVEYVAITRGLKAGTQILIYQSILRGCYMRQYITIELIASVLLGSVSCGLIGFYSGFEELMGYVKSMNVLPELLIYFSVLYLLLLIYFYSLKRNWLVIQEGTIRHRLAATLEEAGPSIIGVFRVMSGMLIVISPAAIIVENNSQAYVVGGLGMFFAGAIIYISAMLQFLSKEYFNKS